MRSAAQELAEEDPEPQRDPAAEAGALIRRDAFLRAENKRLLACLTAASVDAEHDCAEIHRLASELVIVGIRLAENTAALQEVTGALREYRYAVKHAHAAGVALGEARAAATREAPRQRRVHVEYGNVFWPHGDNFIWLHSSPSWRRSS